MKLLQDFQNRIERFLWKHPNFGIRNLMLYVVIGNALVCLLTMMSRSGLLSAGDLVLSADGILRGEVWRLITFVFVPRASNPFVMVLLLYFEFFIGRLLERAWGPGKFTVYYLLGMLFTLVYCLLGKLITGRNIMADATYLNLSMFFVFATLWPDNRVYLFFILPIKVTWLAYAEAALFLYGMIRGRTILPLIGVLNYFLFCGDMLIGRIAMILHRNNRSSVRFRRIVRQQRRDERVLPYTYKCAVCGRTDAEHPELEFRYCSRCTGYHCFCDEHINNHIHFTN